MRSLPPSLRRPQALSAFALTRLAFRRLPPAVAGGRRCPLGQQQRHQDEHWRSGAMTASTARAAGGEVAYWRNFERLRAPSAGSRYVRRPPTATQITASMEFPGSTSEWLMIRHWSYVSAPSTPAMQAEIVTAEHCRIRRGSRGSVCWISSLTAITLCRAERDDWCPGRCGLPEDGGAAQANRRAVPSAFP